MRLRIGILLLVAALPCFGATQATRVVLVKHTRTLSLYRHDQLIGRYEVVLGSRPTGPKRREGDGRTPEGHYVLDSRNPHSGFYKAIHVSYPNARDIARAKAAGVAPGGAVMIHGQKNGLGWASGISRHLDWTRGCIALSDKDMDAVWDSVPVGTPIDIEP